jgi:hypothetical protein
MKANMQKLLNERKQLDDQIAALRIRLTCVETAIELLGGGDQLRESAANARRGEAKPVILNLLKGAGATGLSVSSVVELAAGKGIKLERKTAVSNLSRLKADNLVLYDGGKWRLSDCLPVNERALNVTCPRP